MESPVPFRIPMVSMERTLSFSGNLITSTPNLVQPSIQLAARHRAFRSAIPVRHGRAVKPRLPGEALALGLD